ncbi:hypothetical protein SSYM_2103 [Serratia symbiotica str. Tucson]|uniref:Uncharacterized protein n=1 Tax=Serratia symbiotica str. Tucson TaxID=914128 RepID=E9CNS5_9GAMM|nr:hypothetical protein SSYM_2103 [Serratia symbiotica str. Tucson]
MFKPGNAEYRLLEREPKGWGHLNTTPRLMAHQPSLPAPCCAFK